MRTGVYVWDWSFLIRGASAHGISWAISGQQMNQGGWQVWTYSRLTAWCSLSGQREEFSWKWLRTFLALLPHGTLKSSLPQPSPRAELLHQLVRPHDLWTMLSRKNVHLCVIHAIENHPVNTAEAILRNPSSINSNSSRGAEFSHLLCYSSALFSPRLSIISSNKGDGLWHARDVRHN